MLALLQASTNDVPRLLQILVAVFAVLQSAAIIGGIFAALYRFGREKPHTARLQPAISGVAAIKDGIIHLQVRVSAANVGQVPIALVTEASALGVSWRRTGDPGWSSPPILRNVLEQEVQIQPGETLIDQEWIELPDNNEVAFKLELSLVESEEEVSIVIEVVNLLA